MSDRDNGNSDKKTTTDGDKPQDVSPLGPVTGPTAPQRREAFVTNRHETIDSGPRASFTPDVVWADLGRPRPWAQLDRTAGPDW